MACVGLGWFGFGMALWGVAGGATASAEGRLDDAEVGPEGIDTLFQFARFPQGPPPALVRSARDVPPGSR